MNVKIATVIGLAVAVIGGLTTALVTAGVALNRLAVLEGRVDAAERKSVEGDQVKFMVRDLQNGLEIQRVALDSARREHGELRRAHNEATDLLRTICLSEERQRRTGTSCKVVSP